MPPPKFFVSNSSTDTSASAGIITSDHNQIEVVLTQLRAFVTGAQHSTTSNPPHSSWLTLPLSLTAYEILHRRLSSDSDLRGLWAYYNDKIRSDYSYDKQQIVFRIPHIIHEKVIASFSARLGTELGKLGLAEDITLRHAVPIYLPAAPPEILDIAFGYKEAIYPCIAVEVGYTQSGKELKALAKEYIMNSGGSIALVIGISLGYPLDSGQSCYVFMRKTCYEEEDGELVFWDKEVFRLDFRDGHGKPVNVAEHLILPLSDFVQGFEGDEKEIRISIQDLYEMVSAVKTAAAPKTVHNAKHTKAKPSKRRRSPDEDTVVG